MMQDGGWALTLDGAQGHADGDASVLSAAPACHCSDDLRSASGDAAAAAADATMIAESPYLYRERAP